MRNRFDEQLELLNVELILSLIHICLFFLYYNQNHAGDTNYFREEKEYCYG